MSNGPDSSMSSPSVEALKAHIATLQHEQKKAQQECDAARKSLTACSARLEDLNAKIADCNQAIAKLQAAG